MTVVEDPGLPLAQQTLSGPIHADQSVASKLAQLPHSSDFEDASAWRHSTLALKVPEKSGKTYVHKLVNVFDVNFVSPYATNEIHQPQL